VQPGRRGEAQPGEDAAAREEHEDDRQRREDTRILFALGLFFRFLRGYQAFQRRWLMDRGRADLLVEFT